MKKYVLILFTIIIFTNISCNKDSNITGTGEAILSITEAKIDVDITTIASTKYEKINPEIIEIPLNKDLSVYASIEEENSSESVKNNLKGLNKIADKQVINTDVKYGVLVYLNGTLIPNGQKIFTAGKESQTEGFKLDGGKTYTFVAYSINSNVLPNVSNINTLNTAKINDQSEDLLYFKIDKAIVTGQNNLSINFKHLFTLLKTKLQVSTTYAGKIERIEASKIANSRASATLNLVNGALEYSNNKVDRSIIFPTIPSTNNPKGVSNIESTENLLIAPNSTDDVTFELSAIVVNGFPHSIPATKFKFAAGRKYNLVLTLDVPCTENVSLSAFSLKDGTSQTFTAPAADYGFIFDVFTLDDSFGLNINGTDLVSQRYKMTSKGTAKRTRTRDCSTCTWSNWSYTNFNADFSNKTESAFTNWLPAELEFYVYHDSWEYSQTIENIKFKDGSIWRQNGIPVIWELKGNETTPMLRIVISRDAEVKFFGSKYNYGPLHELAIIPKRSYNETPYLRKNQSTGFPAYWYNYTFVNPTYTKTSTTTLKEEETVSGDITIRTTVETRINPITWKNDGTNQVIATQIYTGPTYMTGNGYGKKKKACGY